MSFCETSITLIPKPGKNKTRKLQTNILCEYTHRNPPQNIRKPNSNILKDYITGASETYLRNARVHQPQKINQCNIQINRLGAKSHTIISTDTEQPLDEIQYPFLITLSKIGMESNFLNMLKGICAKITANVILNGERLKPFPLKSVSSQGCPSLSL